MFRGLTVYQITQSIEVVQERLETALKSRKWRFKACKQHDPSSEGFVPPLGETTKDMMFSANGGILICRRVDTKIIPPAAVKLEVDAMVRAREKDGEDVTKGDLLQWKEEIVTQMLPGAVAAPKWYYAYLDTERRMFFISAGEKESDEFIAFLSKALDGMPFKLIGLQDVDPCDKMTEWLMDPETLGEHFELGHACSLKEPKEGGTANYSISHEDLEDGEIQHLLQSGKSCCRIALEHEELNFAVTSNLRLASLSLSDDVKANLEEELEEDTPNRRKADEFAQWVLITRSVMDELGALLGGWPEQINLDLKGKNDG